MISQLLSICLKFCLVSSLVIPDLGKENIEDQPNFTYSRGEYYSVRAEPDGDGIRASGTYSRGLLIAYGYPDATYPEIDMETPPPQTDGNVAGKVGTNATSSAFFESVVPSSSTALKVVSQSLSEIDSSIESDYESDVFSSVTSIVTETSSTSSYLLSFVEPSSVANRVQLRPEASSITFSSEDSVSSIISEEESYEVSSTPSSFEESSSIITSTVKREVSLTSDVEESSFTSEIEESTSDQSFESEVSTDDVYSSVELSASVAPTSVIARPSSV